MTRILLIDKTKDAGVVVALPAIARALERQCNEEFAASWEISSVTVKVASAEDPACWPCFIVPVLDDPEALAYHTTADGYPVLYVGWNIIRDNGGTLTSGSISLSAAASHEVLETLADAFCDFYARGAHPFAHRMVALEVCDPVQDGAYDAGDGVSVSNFVLPEWFRQGASTEGYDHMGELDAPFQLAPGGYVAFADGSQVFGDKVPAWKKKHLQAHNRRKRRA